MAFASGRGASAFLRLTIPAVIPHPWLRCFASCSRRPTARGLRGPTVGRPEWLHKLPADAAKAHRPYPPGWESPIDSIVAVRPGSNGDSFRKPSWNSGGSITVWNSRFECENLGLLIVFHFKQWATSTGLDLLSSSFRFSAWFFRQASLLHCTRSRWAV